MELPRICQRAPHKVELKPGGFYGWCTCGLSKEAPFCDSSHKDPVETGYKSLKFCVIKPGIYSLCGCKHTKTAPFCDGSHCNI